MTPTRFPSPISQAASSLCARTDAQPHVQRAARRYQKVHKCDRPKAWQRKKAGPELEWRVQALIALTLALSSFPPIPASPQGCQSG
jgi:hypothetical protein